MLKLSGVSAGYDGVDVVHDVSFEVYGNVCIVGPNGCGKTTLLKAIAGIMPSRGEITIADKSLMKMKRHEIAKKIAFLSQQPSVYFAYSVMDTVMMGRYVHSNDGLSNAPSARDKEVCEQSLKAVGMWNARDKSITKLSGGQLQRVFLARALCQEPQVILLDEPTNHLDLKCQIEIITHLKEWAKKESNVVVGVLHDINLAMMLSDDIIAMKNGKIHAKGSATEIISSKALDDVYEIDIAKNMRQMLEKWV